MTMKKMKSIRNRQKRILRPLVLNTGIQSKKPLTTVEHFPSNVYRRHLRQKALHIIQSLRHT